MKVCEAHFATSSILCIFPPYSVPETIATLKHRRTYVSIGHGCQGRDNHDALSVTSSAVPGNKLCQDQVLGSFQLIDACAVHTGALSKIPVTYAGRYIRYGDHPGRNIHAWNCSGLLT